MRTVADELGDEPPVDVRERLAKLHSRLVNELEPHELAEGTELYPVLDRVLGSSEVTTTMTRAHVEISHLIRRYSRLLDDLDDGGPDDSDIVQLRRVLYGLHAICELHFAQEEEAYFSLVEHAAGEAQE